MNDTQSFASLYNALYGADEPWLDALFVTLILAGGCAFMAGRAIARTWRPRYIVVLYMIPLAAAARFIHFALYQGKLIAPLAFAIDLSVLVLIALLSWQRARATQMTEQYYWLYQPHGPFGWRARPHAPEHAPEQGT